jgi:hypothetical protein
MPRQGHGTTKHENRAGRVVNRRAYFRIKLFIGLLCSLVFFQLPAWSAIQDGPSPLEVPAKEKNNPVLKSLLTRLATLEEPVSREGTGYLIAQAPGERYKLQFRLIARGPEAFRLEIFDPFGRPLLYMVSYLGETHLFSIAQQKEIPFPQNFSGPLSAISQMPFTEIAKIFWGRVPLFPYNNFQINTGTEGENESIRLFLDGPIQQELWLMISPFSLIRSRIIGPAKGEALEISFSDFSSIAGNRLPLQCEISQGTGGHTLTVHYDTLILRPDIPEEVFQLPKFPTTPPKDKEVKP